MATSVQVTTAQRPKVLLAAPCYNEEVAIAGVILRAKRHADEVLVIDDGSSDKTVEVARLAGATVLVNPGNKGKGYGVRRAFQYAKEHGYDALVLIDGDGQHDPDEVPLLVEPLLTRETKVDVALGFRHGDNTEMPAWRRVGKRVLDYATAAGGAGVVVDSQCGYRAFGKRAIEAMDGSLQGDGFSIESEQLVIMKEKGLSYDNVTIHCKYDGIDGSTKGPIEHATGVLASIFETMTSRHPMRFIGLPSVALMVVGVWLAIRTFQSYNISHVFSIPSALVAATLGIVAAMGMFFAVMLKMISKVEKRLAKKIA